MTVSACFFKNAVHSTGSSFFDQRLSDRANRLMSLFKGMFPISNETADRQGNLSRLWVLKNGMFLGIVFHSDGKISFVPSNKIINSCNNKPISLENLKRLQDLQIDLAYVPEQKKLVIFPHLRAAGNDQKITQVVEKALHPKPPTSWTPPSLDARSERLGHIFTGELPTWPS
jgi:hypothetical protein